MAIDPFGQPAPAAPAEEAQQPAPPSDPWSAPSAAPSVPAGVYEGQAPDGKHVVTFKGGTAFSDPWYVAHLDSLQEVDDLLHRDAEQLFKVLKRIRVVADAFVGLGNTAPSQPSAPRQAPPAAATTAPAGAPAAPGPDWVYKNGIAKGGRNKGQMWHAWMPPQHLKDVEQPLWFDL